MKYAGFWKRFGAYWLDFLILLPIAFLSLLGNEQSRLFQAYYFVPGLLIGLWFHVYLVARYGGTPGKLLLKIKIAKVDGSDVTYKEAMLRYSVLMVITIVMAAAMIPITLNMSNEFYFSMTWQKRAIFMSRNAPSWYGYANIAMNIWVWSEFIVMLTNKRRRALHDFIAGTVVVHKEIPNNLSQAGVASGTAA